MEGRNYTAFLHLEDKDYTTLALPNNLDVDFSCEKPCPLDATAKDTDSLLYRWAIPFTATTVGTGTLKFDKLRFKDSSSSTSSSSTKKGASAVVVPRPFASLKPAELKVQVYTALKAPLSQIVLPFKHDFKLEISGGTGTYEYKSNSPEVLADTAGKVTAKDAVTDATIEIWDKANRADSIKV